MNTKNRYWIIAGCLNLLTAFVHTFAGQVTSFYLLKIGFGRSKNSEFSNIYLIGLLYCLISVPFVISSVYFKTFAPQWIILLPIGILSLIGLRKRKTTA